MLNKNENYTDNDLLDIINSLIEEFGKDVAILLLNVYKNQYINIDEQLKEINHEELDKYLHKLKGSSANLKFMKIFELCKEFEKDSSSKELKQKLTESMLQILKWIDIYLDNKNNNLN